MLARGGALIRGINDLVTQETGIVAHIAKDPLLCVKKGYHNRSICNEELKNYEKVIEDYDQIIKLYPNYISSFIHKGESLKSLGRTKEALDEYKKVLEIDPQNEEATKRKDELKISN